MRPERYNVRESEAKWRKAWADAQIFKTENDDPRPKYYVLEMFPYPSGRIHMGHVRNYAMGDVVARYRRARGLQRPPPDGLGRVRAAGRERRHAEQHQSCGMDLRQYRRHAGAIAVDGALARLVARDRDLRSELLQAPAEAVPRFPRRRPGRAQEIEGQLGPGRPDGARQRAGDRRARLALRRAGRAARAHPMVPQDHRLFRRSLGEPRSSRALAGKSPPDAEELDRALGGPFGSVRHRSGDARRAQGRKPGERTRHLHDPPGHVVRREVHGDRARPSAGRGSREARPGASCVHRGDAQDRHVRRRDRDGGEEGLRHGPQSAAPVRPRVAPARLCRQFRSDGIRLGRDFRLPRPRSARPRFCPRLWPGRDPGGVPARARSRELHHRRRGL